MKKTYTLDMHTHLLEKKTKPKAYWKRVTEIGLSGVAITEHADCKPERAYRALLEEKPENAVLIAGIEINTAHGHMLSYADDERVYGMREFFKKGVSLEETIDAAKGSGILLSVAHPWGYSHDSMAYLYGVSELEDLVVDEGLGVEAYNGMIGHLSDFIYGSGWIKRPLNFCDFLENNRIARKVGMARLGRKIKNKINEKTMEIIIRCANAVELADKASFVTAGSDAHSPERIGSGIIKIKTEKDCGSAAETLKELQQKDKVVWSGPLVRELPGRVYEKVSEKLRRKEMLQGLKYIAKRAVRRKVAGKGGAKQ